MENTKNNAAPAPAASAASIQRDEQFNALLLDLAQAVRYDRPNRRLTERLAQYIDQWGDVRAEAARRETAKELGEAMGMYGDVTMDELLPFVRGLVKRAAQRPTAGSVDNFKRAIHLTSLWPEWKRSYPLTKYSAAAAPGQLVARPNGSDGYADIDDAEGVTVAANVRLEFAHQLVARWNAAAAPGADEIRVVVGAPGKEERAWTIPAAGLTVSDEASDAFMGLPVEEAAAPAEKISCSACGGTGEGRDSLGCTDCYGKGYSWEPVEEAAAQADCPKCKGAGEQDSGGVTPWGEGINIPCDCPAPAAQPALTDDERAPADVRKVHGLDNALHHVLKTNGGKWAVDDFYALVQSWGDARAALRQPQEAGELVGELSQREQDGLVIAAVKWNGNPGRFPLYTKLYTAAPTSKADAEDAARWRETLKHIGGMPQDVGVQRFTLRYLSPVKGTNIMRGSAAEHFTQAIDAARALAAKQAGEVKP